ncbi:hypothetical protein [Amycolatopsis sp. NBC_00438]|uniref:hypothetical protein n=1 Tax=Amycolatopsis sp. NBC_00438 TaxID=2903558 RepID=UPI002E1F706C
MRTQLHIQQVLLTWTWGGLSFHAVDWLESRGMSWWPAVATMWAALPAGLLLGWLLWLGTGRGPGLRLALVEASPIPLLVLGLTGLLAGTSSRGHLFVLIWLSALALIFLVIIAGTGSEKSADAGNRSRHPDVVQVTTDLGG